MFQINRLSQNDPAWKNDLIGIGSSLDIGKWGCLLTDLTMVVNGYGKDETPDTLNNKFRQVNGGFQGGNIVPGRISDIFSDIVVVKFATYQGSSAPLNKINDALDSGKPVILEVDHSPAPGVQTHWVVAYDKTDKDYLIVDPYPYVEKENPVFLRKRFGFAGSLEDIIIGAIWIDKLVPADVKVPSDVVVTSDVKQPSDVKVPTTRPGAVRNKKIKSR